MNALTCYMRQPGKTSPLAVLVDRELVRNKKSVTSSVDLSGAERQTLLRWINEAHMFCSEHVSRPQKDSALGKTVRELVYVSVRHDVDFVTLKGDGVFLCTEMKYALKPNSYGPFSGARSFVAKVAVKFDELELALSQDSEKHVDARVILVSEEHFERLQMAIEDLKNASETCSSDGLRHNYLLCTLKGLFDFLGTQSVSAWTYQFCI